MESLASGSYKDADFDDLWLVAVSLKQGRDPLKTSFAGFQSKVFMCRVHFFKNYL